MKKILLVLTIMIGLIASTWITLKVINLSISIFDIDSTKASSVHFSGKEKVIEIGSYVMFSYAFVDKDGAITLICKDQLADNEHLYISRSQATIYMVKISDCNMYYRHILF